MIQRHRSMFPGMHARSEHTPDIFDACCRPQRRILPRRVPDNGPLRSLSVRERTQVQVLLRCAEMIGFPYVPPAGRDPVRPVSSGIGSGTTACAFNKCCQHLLAFVVAGGQECLMYPLGYSAIHALPAEGMGETSVRARATSSSETLLHPCTRMAQVLQAHGRRFRFISEIVEVPGHRTLDARLHEPPVRYAASRGN